MRRMRKITASEENFRLEDGVAKRNPVKPETEGTIILIPFRILNYIPDGDGGLLFRLEALVLMKDGKIDESGWAQDLIGLDHNSALVVGEDELIQLLQDKKNLN